MSYVSRLKGENSLPRNTIEVVRVSYTHCQLYKLSGQKDDRQLHTSDECTVSSV